MASAGCSSSTSLTEETPPRAASPPAAQPYQALSNQKLSVQAKKVAYNVYAQVRKSDPQLSVRAACRKVSELTGVSERSVFRIKRMEYFLEKLRMSRSTKDDETPPPSPYADQQRRPSRLLGCQLHYPSPTFIDRVLLARSLKVRRTEGEGVAEFSNSEFVQECLRTHNELRLRHEVPPLRLCSKLCDLAQYWANHLAHTDDFYYRKFRDVGENLFCRWSYVPDFDVTGEQVARYWYSEIKYYDFLLDPSILHVQAGHFSQMVWRSSTTFGVGKARTRSGKIIVVAMYKPAGNVLGEFHRNVLPQPHTDEDEGGVSPQLSDVAAAASAVVAAAASPPSSSRSSP